MFASKPSISYWGIITIILYYISEVDVVLFNALMNVDHSTRSKSLEKHPPDVILRCISARHILVYRHQSPGLFVAPIVSIA